MKAYQVTAIIFFSCILINTGNAKSIVDKKFVSKKQLQNKTPSLTAEKFIAPLSGSFDITSNYIFRGISFSSNLPAFQGGFTYLFPKTGIYVNAWGSNVKFYDFVGNTATVEADIGGGIRNTISNNFTYDLSWIRYSYPKGYHINFSEYLAGFQYYFISTLLGYSSSYFGTGHQGTYGNIGTNYDIPAQYFFNLNGMNFSSGIGYYSLPEFIGSYVDYKIQLSKTIKNYKFSLQWTDTNHKYNIDPTFFDSKITVTAQVTF